MGLTFDSLMELAPVRPPVEKTLDGIGKVFFRHPTFDEWHNIIEAHQKLDGKTAPALLVCKTVATALCDESGTRLMNNQQAQKLNEKDAKVVMDLYLAAISSVFSATDENLEEIEKN